jgi:gliding motility-associated-like protein
LRFTCLLLLSAVATAQVPSATIVPGSFTFCTGTTVNFSAITQGSPTTFSWSVSPARGVTLSPAPDSSHISLSFDTPLNYKLTLVVSNSTSSFSTSFQFAVSRSANAAFSASLDAAGFPTNLILTNFSTNSKGSYWQFSDLSTTDSTSSTTKQYSGSGTYNVVLTALGINGCNGTASYSFTIADVSSVVLPNVFTPNEDDVNDFYRPILQGISQLKARVYNRRGLLLDSWDKVGGHWDGRMNSGEACEDGIYFITVEATGFDGKTYNLTKAFTLLR